MTAFKISKKQTTQEVNDSALFLLDIFEKMRH